MGATQCYGPANFWCLLCDYGNYKMALSTTVKVWQGDQNRYFNWWVQPQKRMKKHIFSENKCQTLVNKNQGKEVNLTGTMSRILVNGFQIVNILVFGQKWWVPLPIIEIQWVPMNPATHTDKALMSQLIVCFRGVLHLSKEVL